MSNQDDSSGKDEVEAVDPPEQEVPEVINVDYVDLEEMDGRIGSLFGTNSSEDEEVARETLGGGKAGVSEAIGRRTATKCVCDPTRKAGTCR